MNVGIEIKGACDKCKRTQTLHSGRCYQCKEKEMGRNPQPPTRKINFQPLGKPHNCIGCGAPIDSGDCQYCGRSHLSSSQIIEKTKQEFYRRYGIPKRLVDGTTSGGPG